MINTSTGALTVMSTAPAEIPPGHVLVQGAVEDIEQVSRAVSNAYRANRKARNRAAKQSRRTNR